MLQIRSQSEIISQWKGAVDQPLVSIICDAFNHEKFISDAIEGFLKQKTNFPFEIIIHEDASTDKTASIIKQYEENYPLLIKPIYQTVNQYSNRSISHWCRFSYPKSRGKYMAICEGDDYWTDENKLQKQIDFLENNPDYVISWTNFVSKREQDFIENEFSKNLPELFTIDLNNIFKPYCTYTLTCVYRKSAIDIERYEQFKHRKDNTLFAMALCHGKGVFMNFKSAVYRWHSGGVFSLRDDFFKRYSSYLNLKEIYDEIPQARTENIKKHVQSLLKESAMEALKLHNNKNEFNDTHREVIKEYLSQSSFLFKLKFFKRFLKTKIFRKQVKKVKH